MLIYGKSIRDKIRSEFAEWAQGKNLELVIVKMEDEASASYYVNAIRNYAKNCQVGVRVLEFPIKTSENDLIQTIEDLNQDPAVTAVLLEKPFPSSINYSHLVKSLSPDKDIEGMHPVNLGKIVSGEPGIRPATPKSVIRMLKENGIGIAGKRVAMIGRSSTVGSPLSLMLTREDATVTLCHTKTKNLPEITLSSDIVVVAVGKAGFLTSNMVNSDSVVIDVGTNADENGKMVGDVAQDVLEKAAIVSAVPGGVGALTVAELFDNLKMIY